MSLIETHMNDENVIQDVKDRAVIYIKRLLFKKPNIIQSIKKIIKNLIIFSDSVDDNINENIAEYEYAGYKKSASFLKFFHIALF